jgi:hypoxanthine phosphoribosyltransferase
MAMPKKVQCELISWNRIASLSKELATQIKQDDFHPDVIIAIGRGGYVPARLLADNLDIMNLTSIKVEHYTSGTHKQDKATVKYPLSIDVSGQQVLVVDDVSDSGDTFAVAMQHITEKSTLKKIKTAVLHHKTTSQFIPDYYAAKVIKWRWLIYPWAQVEDIAGFITEMSPHLKTLPDIAAQLKESYGIQVPDKLLKYVLDTLILHAEVYDE